LVRFSAKRLFVFAIPFVGDDVFFDGECFADPARDIIFWIFSHFFSDEIFREKGIEKLGLIPNLIRYTTCLIKFGIISSKLE